MNLKIIEITLNWLVDNHIKQLRPFILDELHQHGKPLRWAITHVSESSPNNLAREITVEAVVITNE